MTDAEYRKVMKKRAWRQSKQNAVEALDLANKMADQHPELTENQTLLSAYILSGRNKLNVSKLKLQ